MITVSACNSSLTPAVVFLAINELLKSGRRPVSAVVGPAQNAAWLNCAIMSNGVEFDSAQFPDLKQKITMGGIPIELREDIRNSEVIFVDEFGKEIGTIRNLAIPIGFNC